MVDYAGFTKEHADGYPLVGVCLKAWTCGDRGLLVYAGATFMKWRVA